LIPHASLEVTNVLKKLLRYDPEERITARHGLLSPYFDEAPERTATSQLVESNCNSVPPTSTFYSNPAPQNSHTGGGGGGGDEDGKTNLPPIHLSKARHMKPFKFKPKNFGMHSTITGGFAGHIYNNSNMNNAYGSGMNATMQHKNKFIKKNLRN